MQASSLKVQTTRLVFRVMDRVAPGVAAQNAFKLFTTPRRRHTSRRDQSVMDAATVLHSTYTEGQLVGYSWGEGPSILLIHGWEGSARNFTSLVMPLVNAGFRVIAFDAPAHGASDGRRSNGVEYATVLSALITEFGPMYGVIAHSIGAVATVFMMGTMKHRRIQRLTLIGAPCEMSDVMSRFADEINVTDRTLNRLHTLTHQKLGVPISAFSIKSIIPYITAPGLIIHDRQDRVIPYSDAETIAAHWTEGTLIPTQGLGHYKILRDADVISQLTAFMVQQSTMEALC